MKTQKPYNPKCGPVDKMPLKALKYWRNWAMEEIKEFGGFLLEVKRELKLRREEKLKK